MHLTMFEVVTTHLTFFTGKSKCYEHEYEKIDSKKVHQKGSKNFLKSCNQGWD